MQKICDIERVRKSSGALDSFVCVSSHFMCLRNVHFYSLYSVAKSEHSDLQGWADGIQSGAKRDDLPYRVVSDLQ